MRVLCKFCQGPFLKLVLYKMSQELLLQIFRVFQIIPYSNHNSHPKLKILYIGIFTILTSVYFFFYFKNFITQDPIKNITTFVFFAGTGFTAITTFILYFPNRQNIYNLWNELQQLESEFTIPKKFNRIWFNFIIGVLLFCLNLTISGFFGGVKQAIIQILRLLINFYYLMVNFYFALFVQSIGKCFDSINLELKNFKDRTQVSSLRVLQGRYSRVLRVHHQLQKYFEVRLK